MKTLSIILLALSLFSCIKEPHCEINNPQGTNYKGCGDFTVFQKYSNDSIEHAILHVNMDNAYERLTTEFQEFEIGITNNLWTSISIFNQATENGNLCTDGIIYDLDTTDEFYAVSGTIKTKIVRDKSSCDATYVVDVFAENLLLQNSNGDEIMIDNVTFEKVMMDYLIP